MSGSGHRWLLAAALCAGCGDPAAARIVDTGLAQLTLSRISPDVVLPGTVIVLEGDSFVDAPWGQSELRMQGHVGGDGGQRWIDVRLPATFVDYQRLEATVDSATFQVLGGADAPFSGVAVVEVQSGVDGRVYRSEVIDFEVEIRTALDPELDIVEPAGVVFPNEPIGLRGSGLLLPGEGETTAVLEGCFTAEGGDSCVAVAMQEVPIVPEDQLGRDRGSFAFVPRIVGIAPGRFEGTVVIRNRHTAGHTLGDKPQAVAFDLEEPIIYGASTTAASLGQHIGVQGAGFLGGGEGTTALHFQGQFTPDRTGLAVGLDQLLLPEWVDGRMIRYIVNEDDSLGQLLDVRLETGTFEGLIVPIIEYEGTEISGDPTPISFRLEPVKQVVYINFTPGYRESLRHFGLRAVDQQIRQRVLAAVRRDYATVNVEVRTEEPDDFALFAQVDVSGPDPNGLGLLGYDNTPGKDTENLRLYDRIGGVNALTQEDGFPGFGGVFIESLFGYSADPAQFAATIRAEEKFDELFDPFRPDRGGSPVLAEDLQRGVPELQSGSSCPVVGERRLQLGCAVWALGSMIGTTISHEIGHSLGLADPYGPFFHNNGDAPDRLMDADRPFTERAEIGGAGPSRFCDDEYVYLRGILPTTEAPDPEPRPGCF